MKLFLKKISFFVGLLLSAYILIFIISSNIVKKKYPNLFNALVIDKYDAINNKSNIENKRLILMGGSNTIFSIDSELMEEELGIEVVNSGLVFNTGYGFQMNFLKKYSKKNDVILYLPEFKYYSASGERGNDFLINCLLYKPELFSIIGPKNISYYFTNGLKVNLKPITSVFTQKPLESVIKTQDFNSKGDLLFHLDKKPDLEKITSYPIVNSLDINKKFIEDIEELNSSLEKKEAKTVISFPIYSKKFVSKDLIKEIDSLAENNKLFIGNFKEHLYDDECFYDSPYHALKEARKQYTLTLIKYLKNVI